jgi:thiamine transport system ATP-binding protein
MTVLFVTHQPEDARRIADQLVFLEDRTVKAAGSVSEFFSEGGPGAFSRYIGADISGGGSRDVARKRT